jgi:hypothetical protein
MPFSQSIAEFVECNAEYVEVRKNISWLDFGIFVCTSSVRPNNCVRKRGRGRAGRCHARHASKTSYLKFGSSLATSAKRTMKSFANQNLYFDTTTEENSVLVAYDNAEKSEIIEIVLIEQPKPQQADQRPTLVEDL